MGLLFLNDERKKATPPAAQWVGLRAREEGWELGEKKVKRKQKQKMGVTKLRTSLS